MAIYTILNKKQITQLSLLFGLNKPQNIRGVVEGTVNTYYRFNSDGEIYYLKIDEVAHLPRLKREIKMLQLLLKKKLPFQTPFPIKAFRAQHFLPFKNKFVLIFPEIKGVSAMKPNEAHLRQIGAALATMHLATQKVKLEQHRFSLKGLHKVFREISPRLEHKHPSIHTMIVNLLIEMKNHSPKKIPYGLIHADLFPENILFVGKQLSGFIDFEAAGKGPFLFDIAVCLHALCHNGKSFDKKKIKAFWQGYTRVRPIKNDEKKHLIYYLKQSALRLLLTRLRDFELKDGPVKASPFKDYREFVRRFEEIENFKAI